MKLFSGFRSAGTIANPSANQCATLPFTFQSSRTRECARFTISWATNLSIIVQATTNLANPVWTPLATNPLVGGMNYFSDPKWTNYPRRFYRVRSQ